MLLDKFYTKPEIAVQCCKLFKRYAKPHKSDLIVEPSAGSGAFIEPIKRLAKNYIFIDIKPEHPDIEKTNFLKLKQFSHSEHNIHIIGNPPFGRKASTAIRFIKHCAQLNASSISFILPRSFKKPSMQKTVPTAYHLKYQADLPYNSFIKDNNPYNVPCVFQIWIRKRTHRRMPKRHYTNANYEFTKKHNCNIAIRRVGFNIGRVHKCLPTDNPNSHYFIRLLKNQNINQIMHKMNRIKYKKNANTGAYSIAKQELIKKYNKII